jgi:hypothetical protein
VFSEQYVHHLPRAHRSPDTGRASRCHGTVRPETSTRSARSSVTCRAERACLVRLPGWATHQLRGLFHSACVRESADTAPPCR